MPSRGETLPVNIPSIDSLPSPPEDLSHGDVRLRFVQLVPGNPARGFVPSYHFRILDPANHEVGHINLRVGDSDHIWYSAGHIGYGVDEDRRGLGYAGQACRALAPFARSISEVVIITCDPENGPSRRTIEKLGATFLEVVDVPPGDPQYEAGCRQKRRYEWRP